MERYRFRRKLWIDDPDPALEWTKQEREDADWPKQIDGRFVTRIDERGQWWVDGCKVNKDWCEKAPCFSVTQGGKPNDDGPIVA